MQLAPATSAAETALRLAFGLGQPDAFGAGESLGVLEFGSVCGGGAGASPQFLPLFSEPPRLPDAKAIPLPHRVSAFKFHSSTFPPFHFSTRNGRDARCPARLPKKCEKATMQAERRFGIIRGMTKNAKSFAVTALAIAGAITEPLRSAASGARSVEEYLDLPRPKLMMKGSKR